MYVPTDGVRDLRDYQVGGPLGVVFDADVARGKYNALLESTRAMTRTQLQQEANSSGYHFKQSYREGMRLMDVPGRLSVAVPMVVNGTTLHDPIECARAELTMLNQTSSTTCRWYSRAEIQHTASRANGSIPRRFDYDVLDEVECHEENRPTHLRFTDDDSERDIPLMYNKSGIARLEPPIPMCVFPYTMIHFVFRSDGEVTLTLRVGIVPRTLVRALMNARALVRRELFFWPGAL
jgi:hypothetical protein